MCGLACWVCCNCWIGLICTKFYVLFSVLTAFISFPSFSYYLVSAMKWIMFDEGQCELCLYKENDK